MAQVVSDSAPKASKVFHPTSSIQIDGERDGTSLGKADGTLDGSIDGWEEKFDDGRPDGNAEN